MIPTRYPMTCMRAPGLWRVTRKDSKSLLTTWIWKRMDASAASSARGVETRDAARRAWRATMAFQHAPTT